MQVMLEHAARMEFDLTNKCKVWYESQNGDVLLSEDETLLEAGVQNGQVSKCSKSVISYTFWEIGNALILKYS